MGLLLSKVMEEAVIFLGARIRHFAKKKKSQQHGQGTFWTFSRKIATFQGNGQAYWQ
jgi:hypothetical protein